MAFTMWNQIEDLRLEDVSAGVDVLAGCFVWAGFFQEASHMSVILGFNDAVSAGVLDRSKNNRGHCVSLFMLANDGFQIQISQNVAVENHRWFANQVFGKLICSSSTHRLRFNGVPEINAEL